MGGVLNIINLEYFNIQKFTKSPLQIEANIQFERKTAAEVFNIIGDPEFIPQWFLLAKSIKFHPEKEGKETSFNVEFTFFGDVYEEVLEWNPPFRYVYLAKGKDFPIKNYVASFEINELGKQKGILTWKIYYNEIEGAHFQKILPVILPPIIRESFERLSPLIGGINMEIKEYK